MRWGLGGQGIELFDWGEAFSPVLLYQVAFLQHVHELAPDQRVVGRCKRLEAEHGTRDPFDGAMIIFDHIIQVFDLTDDDVGAVCLVVAREGGFIGLTSRTPSLLATQLAERLKRHKPHVRSILLGVYPGAES